MIITITAYEEGTSIISVKVKIWEKRHVQNSFYIRVHYSSKGFFHLHHMGLLCCEFQILCAPCLYYQIVRDIPTLDQPCIQKMQLIVCGSTLRQALAPQYQQAMDCPSRNRKCSPSLFNLGHRHLSASRQIPNTNRYLNWTNFESTEVHVQPTLIIIHCVHVLLRSNLPKQCTTLHPYKTENSIFSMFFMFPSSLHFLLGICAVVHNSYAFWNNVPAPDHEVDLDSAFRSAQHSKCLSCERWHKHPEFSLYLFSIGKVIHDMLF